MSTYACPTPDKKRFRSQAEAARWQRDRRPPTGEHKQHLYPYEYSSGDHWHLTSHTPQKQQEIAVRVAASTPSSNTFETHDLRHILINGEPWFVAADVARTLGYRDAFNLARRIEPEDKGTRPVSTPGGPQDMAVISEAGLYVAIFGSHAEHALRFKRWVTRVLLPTIRKTGRFDSNSAVALPDRKTLAQWVVDAETRAEIAEAKVIELTPPAAAWTELADSSGDYGVDDAAKVLSRDPNINTGERRLYQFMRSIGWVFKGRENRWRAYQAQIECGRLAEKAGGSYWHEGRQERVAAEPTVRITPKGLAELHQRLGATGDGDQLALVVST